MENPVVAFGAGVVAAIGVGYLYCRITYGRASCCVKKSSGCGCQSGGACKCPPGSCKCAKGSCSKSGGCGCKSGGACTCPPGTCQCGGGVCPVAGKPSNFKLTYFNGRGKAEGPRLIFALAGQAYEDERFPISFLPGGGYERKEFLAAQAAGRFLFDQVPMLTVDGNALVQSAAIERYLARKFGLLSVCPFETAVIEQFTEEIADLDNAFAKAYYVDIKDREASLMTFTNEALPKYLGLLERASNSQGYMVGLRTTLADVKFFQIVDRFVHNDFGKVGADILLVKYPKLLAIYHKFAAAPKVAAYLQSRPNTPF